MEVFFSRNINMVHDSVQVAHFWSHCIFWFDAIYGRRATESHHGVCVSSPQVQLWPHRVRPRPFGSRMVLTWARLLLAPTSDPGVQYPHTPPNHWPPFMSMWTFTQQRGADSVWHFTPYDTSRRISHSKRAETQQQIWRHDVTLGINSSVNFLTFLLDFLFFHMFLQE